MSSVSWSGDGRFVGVTKNDDSAHVYYSDNLSSVHGTISADVGGGDYPYDIDLSPDGEMAAISIGRSGNGGTNGVVRMINMTDGSVIQNLNPGGEDRFYSAEFSPTGSHLLIGSNNDFYVVETSSWSTVRSESSPNGAVNSVDWSHDGKHMAICEGWDGGGATIRLYAAGSWTQKWSKSISTSCLSSDFSPDGRQVIFGMSWYQGDGATARIYEVSTGNGVDNIVQPRPVTAVLVTATIVGKITDYRGLQTVRESLKRSEGTTKVSTFGLRTLIQTTMVGIHLTKATADPMHSQMMVLSGMIPTMTDTETIHYQHLKEMRVQILTEPVTKTGSVAPMATVMVTLTKEMCFQPTTNNGLILILMAVETITTTMYNHLLNCT